MKNVVSSRLAGAGHRRNSLRLTARAQLRGRVVSSLSKGIMRTKNAFTLTEILVALALILIVGSLTAANFFNIANGVDHLPPKKVLQSTIREGRFLAMQRMSPIIITYNGDDSTFDILDDQGNVIEQTPSGLEDPTATLKLTFKAILPLTDLTSDPNPPPTVGLSADQAAAQADESDDDSSKYVKDTTDRLTIDPSGVTAPVRVTLSQDDKDSSFDLDPFSEGPPPIRPDNIPPLTDQ